MSLRRWATFPFHLMLFAVFFSPGVKAVYWVPISNSVIPDLMGRCISTNSSQALSLDAKTNAKRRT